jgi:hypothetical protein
VGFLAFVVAAAFSLPAPVMLDGVGGATPGMTPRQVGARWHLTLRLSPPIGAPGSTCRTATVSVGGLHGYALFENNRLGAVFFDRGARTPSGIGIGSSESALRRTYAGRLRREGHAYVHGGHYYFLTRRSAPHWRIRFDTNGRGRVTQIGFGARAVSYVEGCA